MVFWDVQTPLMNLPDIKKLSKIIDLCRKKGVASIEIDGVKLTLGQEVPKKSRKTNPKTTEEPIVIDSPYSDMDTLFWSSAGIGMEQEDA